MGFDANITMNGPFAMQSGHSYVSFGELLQATRERGPGRYPGTNGNHEVFHLVLYEDGSWRISTPQLPIFEKAALDALQKDHLIHKMR